MQRWGGGVERELSAALKLARGCGEKVVGGQVLLGVRWNGGGQSSGGSSGVDATRTWAEQRELGANSLATLRRVVRRRCGTSGVRHGARTAARRVSLEWEGRKGAGGAAGLASEGDGVGHG